MQRFYVTFSLQIDMKITDVDIVHQLTRVLRIQAGDHIILFSWDGRDMEYEIISIDKKSLTLKWVAQYFPNTEPKKQVILYQAIPNKYEKIEYILQKWVEIGIHQFVFFRSDRSQKLIVSSAKIERFVSIAREALEQCGGTHMPEIVFVDKMPLWKEDISHLVLDTTGNTIQFGQHSTLREVGIWVWPEGGWSDNEREVMTNNGYIFARFWERVLRTETAWIVIGFGLINS